jgi:threonine aldolase
MNFASDNTAGVAPEVLAAIKRANQGSAAAYGADETSRRLDRRFADFFDHPVRVFPVATGTAANALALAAMTPPYGAIYAHEEAHVATDECGAPEFFTGGAKVVTVAGDNAKIAAKELARQLDSQVMRVPHNMKPAAVSISQATEAGTVYTPDDVAALAEVAARRGLKLHMDGARFANALVHLGCRPADATWKCGVDALSLGFTKNGALAAEAVIFFGAVDADQVAYRRKRGGHLFSKMRYASIQLEAMLDADLWRKLAGHANAMAAALAEGLGAVPGARLVHPVEANEVFVLVPDAVARAFARAHLGAHRWNTGTPAMFRFVTAFNTKLADVRRAVTIAQSAAAREGSRPRRRRAN